MPDQTASMNRTSPTVIGRHSAKLPEDEQEQKLSYQTNKLAQYVQLQLSDLENTLHYIQKKHSINQIKECISHAYSIFSQTQPVFRELRIVFIYDKIKKLVNCFSIIYLILMEHIQKPLKTILETDTPKHQTPDPNQDQNPDHQEGPITARTQKKKTLYSQNNDTQTIPNPNKKPKPLGGVHLFNEQYNRHIESDLDRLKRKLKEQAKEAQQKNPQISEKDKLKEQVFKQINSDVYGSPSTDELTLFFNLNSNRYGSDLQYITFQDELQEIATFFKESQDEALEFLNKSRDDFIFLNFNQGFKEMMLQYKVEKQEQVNGFVAKVKNLFEAIKNKTVERQNEINQQIVQLRKIEKRIMKPLAFEMEVQTSFSFQEEINKYKKKIEEIECNYKELQIYHSKENDNDSKNITFLEHKIAFKEHEIAILKKDLDEKNHFIDFLNEKINIGTDHKVLRKISNIYRNHSKKNSNKIKMELQQLEKQVSVELIGLKRKDSMNSIDEEEEHAKKQAPQKQEEDQDDKNKQQEKKLGSSPYEDYQKPAKKKRKQGMSFFAVPQKRFTSYVERNASFNIQNGRIQQEKSELQEASSGDRAVFQKQVDEKNGQSGVSPRRQNRKTTKNFVKPERRKSQDRNSLQVMQKSKSKNYEPKRSAFASGNSNTKLNSGSVSKFGDKRTSQLTNSNISEESFRENYEEQEELMRELNGIVNNDDLTDGDYDYDETPDQQGTQMDVNEENLAFDEVDQRTQKLQAEILKRTSINKGIRKSQMGQYVLKNKITDGAKNVDSDTNKKVSQDKKQNTLLNSPRQQTEGSSYNAPFKKKQSVMENSIKEQNSQFGSKNTPSKGSQAPSSKNTLIVPKKSNLGRISLQQRDKYFMNNLNEELTKNNDGFRVKKRLQKFQSQALQGNQNESKSDIGRQDDEASEMSYDDGITRFLKTVSGDSNFDVLSNKEKDNMISTYFTTIYKHKKINSSNLCSCLINITIGPNDVKPSQFQVQRNGQSSKQISEYGQETFIEKNTINTPSRSSFIVKPDDFKEKVKQFSQGTINQLKRSKGKLSELGFQETRTMGRKSHRMSENIHLLANNLSVLKDISCTPQAEEEHDGTENSKKEIIEEDETEENRESNIHQKKPSNSTDYERIYGITSSSWNRNKRDNTNLSQMNEQDKQKMEEYLEKAAIKTAMKSKNVEEFKAKIKKMHISRCGQNCKHLERYLQNFNKYRSCNREIMKVHIENVHNLIPSESQATVKSNKENSVVLPSINTFGPDSSKGFGSIQRNIGTASKK